MTGDSFDAIVIGSGFGGAVAACRMAQAGLRVLILERGRRYPRGSFPRSFAERRRWLYSQNEQGLIDAKPLVTEMIALQAAGYGGGSLIYNNVQMRAAAQIFKTGWPAGYDRTALDPYYDLVGHMLDVNPVSADQPLGVPQRTAAFRRAAAALGRDQQFFLPNLAVDFAPPGQRHTNKFGVEQEGCTHCGECYVGCNVHAKNTLDLNYLAVAEQRGAEARTRCQVERITPLSGGYVVFYRDFNDQGREQVARARHVFVCAGSINSTELLLRCRDIYGTLPHISDRLGSHYSANGDFLAMVFRTREPLSPTRGPAITAAILHDREQAAEQTFFLIEDCGAGEEVARRGQMLDPGHMGTGTGRTLWNDVLRGLAGQLSGPLPDSNVERSSAILCMGKDNAGGTISLDPATGLLRLHWDVGANLRLYNEQARLAADVANMLGGEVAYNPLWKQLHQPITIHNLGGCGMADDAAHGVTDPHGEVFGHPGLFVLDGARLPGAVGSNPSHTIAATAERSIEAFIRRCTGSPQWQAPERALARRIEEPLDRVQVPVGGTQEPQHQLVGMTFRETMRGHVSRQFADSNDYLAAEKAGRAHKHDMSFTLQISAPDLDAFLAERDHTAIAEGTVHVHDLTPKEGAHVSAGVFNLFVETGVQNARKMLYALPFYGVDGKPYLLDGWKDVRDHGTFDVWESTTTLYTTVREGHSRQGAIVALGTLKIDVPSVLQLVASLQISGTQSAVKKAVAIDRIGSAFFGTLWKVFIQPRLPGMGARH